MTPIRPAPETPDPSDPIAVFESHRRHLEGVAYRILGTLDEARDAVQETSLKWCDTDPTEIVAPRGWLTTVCTRISLNMLRAPRRKREEYPGTWLPEPYLGEGAERPDPLEIDESISLALLTALERLAPVERVAFILREVFDLPYTELAHVLERSEESCRQVVTRARRRVREDRPRFSTSAEEHRSLLEAFYSAARRGDLTALRGMIADDAALHSDGGGKASAVPTVMHGGDRIARFFLGVWGKGLSDEQHSTSIRRFNGAPGLLIFDDGLLVSAVTVAVTEGRIARIFAHRNPDKLAQFGERG